MDISLVVAVSSNGVIGRDGDMPWRLSTDLKRFKALTLGKPVIMGRKTFQSIGKPLPGRLNIIVTRDAAFKVEGCVTATSLEEAVMLGEAEARQKGLYEICIIGGGEIYRQALETGLATVVHLTHVDAELDGDTRFPPLDPAVWAKESEADFPAGEKDNFPTRYAVYRRL
ncbi:dihydrofolate reductase [Rhizobium sp. PAMB 3182]